MIDPQPPSSSSSSPSGDTLLFAVHYPPNSSKPQLLSLGSSMTSSSCGNFNSTLTNTILDLSEVIPTDEPLDLSTPTLRENLTMESSLKEASKASAFQEVMDPNVAMATMSAVSTGTITPLIKEELRCTIQQKRLSNGKEELEVNFEERKPCKLSPADVERKVRRRERNRVAAQKCRGRRREKADILQLESAELEDRNEVLRDEISQLEEERDRLAHMLRTHDILPTKCNQKLSINSDEGISIETSCEESTESFVFEEIIETMEHSDNEEVLEQVI